MLAVTFQNVFDFKKAVLFCWLSCETNLFINAFQLAPPGCVFFRGIVLGGNSLNRFFMAPAMIVCTGCEIEISLITR
jgi:hypothetical protein